MSDSDRSFIEELKRQGALLILAQAIVMIITLVGFYYRTEAKMENFTERQRTVEIRIEMLNDRKIEKVDYIREVDEMKMLLRQVNNKVDKLFYGQ